MTAGPPVPAFLAHLRRDDRGIPVPWINQWGSEDVARYRLAHDSTVGALAVFLDDDPDGAPDFTRQNLARARESVVTGRCQVCARHVPWSRRRLVLSQISLERVHVDDLGERVVVTEPWLDERCATFAVERCPGLIRRTRADDLVTVKVTGKRQAQVVLSVGYVDGPLEEASRRLNPVMWAKLALSPALFAGVGRTLRVRSSA